MGVAMALQLLADREGKKVWKGSENDKSELVPNPGDEFYTTNSKKHYICRDIGVWTFCHKTG